MSSSARMCSANEFHAAGMACEKARSPNLVLSCGIHVSQSTTLTLGFDRGVVGWHSGGQISWTSAIKT